MILVSKRLLLAGALMAPVMLMSDTVCALDRVRLGKAVPNSFAFAAAEIGVEAKNLRTGGNRNRGHQLSR